MKKSIIAALVVLLCSHLSFSLGALYGRRALTNDTSKALWLKTYDADVTITDQIAITHVDQTFKNEDNYRKEGVFVFPLPENAVVTELALWINGQRVIGEIKESQTARNQYDSIVRRRVDPALLEYMGNNVFKLSVFPIEPVGNAMSERRIEITYAELLPCEANVVPYKFFMKTVNLSSKPLERASLVFSLSSQRKILSLASPSHNALQGLVVNRIDAFHSSGTYGEENAHSEKDLLLNFELENDAYLMNYLTYTPHPDTGMFFDSLGDNSYFLLWVNPPDSITESQVLPKNVVFVADVSSSMAGARIEQLRTSLNAMVDMLNPEDRFNIITFATKPMLFKTNLAPVNAGSKAEAHAYINQLGEGGLTNMEEALVAALAQAFDSTAVNAVIFLTDGVPTWPAGSTADRIAAKVDSVNAQDVTIHTFGIGADIEEGFLKKLARDNKGLCAHILANDSINRIMQSFMQKISYPLISNLSLSYGGLNVYDIFPRTLPNLYWGSQLTVLGRYRNNGAYSIKLNGMLKNRDFSLSQNLAFPAATDNHPFVPRMWASAKIDFLLDDIAIYGELPELVDEVLRLGLKYAIITPYTSMLVIEPTKVAEDKTAPLAQRITLRNAPNPFNPTTTLQWSVPRQERPVRMMVRIYDVRGQLIKTMADELTMGGSFIAQWDGKDAVGRQMSSGFYFAVLEAGTQRLMIKMHLIK